MEVAFLILLICLLGMLVFILFYFKFQRKNAKNDLQSYLETLDHQSQLNFQKTEELYQLQLKTIKEESENRFKVLAHDILYSNAELLNKSNKEQIENILTPLKERIEAFNKSINENNIRETTAHAVLNKQIESLMELNASIGKEAKDLANALRKNPKAQGNWGEIVLETLLENAGLEKGINFLTQVTTDSSGKTLHDDQGNNRRPDVIIQLPDNKKIIIDSKVSLTAYIDLMTEEDETVKKNAVKRHLISVKSHIDELGTKRYQDIVPGAMEQVLMFIPNEGAYIAAINEDDDLWNYAFKKGVVLVSSSHLYSILHLVTQLWRQEKQNKNAELIAKAAGAMYDKLNMLVDDFNDLDNALKRLEKARDNAYMHLSSGKGNLLSQAEKIKKLGAKTTKSFPPNLLDEAEATNK